MDSGYSGQTNRESERKDEEERLQGWVLVKIGSFEWSQYPWAYTNKSYKVIQIRITMERETWGLQQ